MARWGTIWKKEVKENLRDWRVVVPTLVVGPIISPMFVAIMISTVLTTSVERNDQDLELAVVGAEFAPNLLGFLKSHRASLETLAMTRDEAIEMVRDRKRELVVVVSNTIGPALTEGRTATVEMVFDQSRRTSITRASRAELLLRAYGEQLGAIRLFARGIDPNLVRPIAVSRVDVSTPSGRAVILLGFVTYIIVFAVLMGGLAVTNDSTAGERERKSLEPLLTTPVSRTQLLIEKIFVATFFMTLALIICVSVLSYVLGFVPLERLGMRSNFGVAETLAAIVIMLPFTIFGAGLMSVVASFTKTYKEAQTYLGVVVMVPTIPIIFAGIADVKSESLLMLVPSLSHHLLLTSLLKAEPLNPVNLATSAGSTLLVAALLIALATRLYRREGLLV